MARYLNLGCGKDLREGEKWVNADIVALPGVDEVMDMNKPWPWPDHTFGMVLALDVLEHGRDKMHLMEEMWRVMVHGGRATIQTPNFETNPAAWGDPTHRLPWHRENMEFFCPCHSWNYYTRARFITESESHSTNVLTWNLRAIKVENSPLASECRCRCCTHVRKRS